MKARSFAIATVFFLIAIFVLISVQYGPDLLARLDTGSVVQASTVMANTATGNAIVKENAEIGTVSWPIPNDRVSTTEIQAYADSTSVAPGSSIAFFVSTKKADTQYRMDLYRLGWYNGAGGRLMKSVEGLTAQAQGYYDLTTRQIVACTTCFIDSATGLIEARWQQSYSLLIPSTWVTGLYLAKFTEAGGRQTYASFEVLGNEHADYLAVVPETTAEADNIWGGESLNEPDGVLQPLNATRATRVSFDRPYVGDNGAGQVLDSTLQSIRWFEQKGYDISYTGSVNLHEHPDQLLNHKAFLSLSHDEYWTKEIRDGIENARDKGVGLAFLGANTSRWQMRLEPNAKGVANRTVICYKVESSRGSDNLQLDPLYSKDNTRVTTLWRDPVLNRPENTLVGVMYSDMIRKRMGYNWTLDLNAKSPLLDNTGLEPGKEYSCGVVGYEWDKVYPGSPKGLTVLATSKTLNEAGVEDVSNTTTYIAASGALVFASGSLYWSLMLDSYRFQTDPLCSNVNSVVPGTQALMANIMTTLVQKNTPPA